ncbi:unnamed protein product [Parascedosporium putredinis]|uniref:RRM domain-containing protein n=1 Tax=Parascedosporium putredinis TaxID=1442378 RepID=A0A9P1H2R0_9PEZI|nr:unnamed protein product [Parascedosporium putredinis]CAI7993809.1 unnamed protein product [Parascedosporium putredinis]
MVAPGPTSDVNREYFAQNNERAIEEGRGGVEEYEKTDEKARELLRRLATSKPYFRKGPTIDNTGAVISRGHSAVGSGLGGPGPIRTRDSHWLPPDDESIMSLFLTGVEDDLPEYKIRDFFQPHGKIKSLICSHMSHCAFINFETREAAEKAALSCQGRAVIAGCPLRVRWKAPSAVGNMNREQRSQMLMDARRTIVSGKPRAGGQNSETREESAAESHGTPSDQLATVAPPGTTEVPGYASLDGF